MQWIPVELQYQGTPYHFLRVLSTGEIIGAAPQAIEVRAVRFYGRAAGDANPQIALWVVEGALRARAFTQLRESNNGTVSKIIIDLEQNADITLGEGSHPLWIPPLPLMPTWSPIALFLRFSSRALLADIQNGHAYRLTRPAPSPELGQELIVEDPAAVWAGDSYTEQDPYGLCDNQELMQLVHQKPELRWALKFAPSSESPDCFPSLEVQSVRRGDPIVLWPLGIAAFGELDKCDFRVHAWSFTEKNSDENPPTGPWRVEAFSSWSDDTARPDYGFTPIARWNELLAKPYYAALSIARGATPASLVPTLFSNLTDAQHKPRVVPQRWVSTYEVFETAPVGGHTRLQFRFVSLNVGDFENLGMPSPPEGIQLFAVFPKLLDQTGTPVVRFVELRPASVGDSQRPSVRFTMRDVTDAKHAQLQPWGVESAQDTEFPWEPRPVIRVGSLDLRLAAAERSNPAEGPVLGLLVDLRACYRREASSPPSLFKPGFELSASFLLEAFAPADQDPAPADKSFGERDPSLLIPVAAGGLWVTGELELRAFEKAYRGTDKTLSLRIERPGTEASVAPNLEAIILDTEPAFLARVWSSIDFGASGQVAAWTELDPAGAGWEFVDTGDGMMLALPPQAIGEEFIDDYGKSPLDPNKTLDYRFSPPGLLRLSRTPFEKRFSEAPWNLRRLLGYAGERLPGARALSLDFELLYGLGTSIVSDGLYIAEVGARVGKPPARLKDLSDRTEVRIKSADATLRERLADAAATATVAYDRTFDVMRKRVGVLVTHDGVAQTSKLDLGVSYRFRANSSANPLKPEAGLLRGGVKWGFESPATLDEVIARPSSSGFILNPTFTMLGGSGYQKAAFANDKSKIYSNSYLGRTFFYSVERVGRIGVLWNRAKHVVVFERSTVASPDRPGGAAWEGRAVVRKVREYVEVIEETRAFPDANGSPQQRGFVEGSHFPHPIFSVDGRVNGRDIPGGWIVPLYAPSGVAAASNTEPAVFLNLAASPGSGRKQTPARICNPQVLTFFTSTNPNDTSDSDRWAAVPNVDFAIEDIPTLDAPAAPDGSEARLPDAPRQQPGYEHFTFELDTGGLTTNLVAGRSDTTAEVRLENVTLVRRNERIRNSVPASPYDDPLKGLADAARNAGDRAAAVVRSVMDETATLPTALSAYQTEVRGALVELQKGFTPHDTLASLAARQKSALEGWITDIDALVDGAIAQIPSDRAPAVVAHVVESVQLKLGSVVLVAQEASDAAQRALRSMAQASAEITRALDDAKLRASSALLRLPPIGPPNSSDLLLWQTAAFFLSADLTKRVRQQMALLEGYPIWLAMNTKLLLGAVSDAFDKFSALTARPPDVRVFVVDTLSPILKRLTDAQDLQTTVQNHASVLGAAAQKVRADIDKSLALVKATDLTPEGVRLRETLRGAVENACNGIRNTVMQLDLSKDQASLDAMIAVFGALDKVDGSLVDELDAALLLARKLSQSAVTLLALPKIEDNVRKELRHAAGDTLNALLGHGSAALSSYGLVPRAEVTRALDAAAATAGALGDAGMRLVRAFGDAPIAGSLDLNRTRLAYFFHEAGKEANKLADVVLFTPSTVLVNRVGHELDQLDLRSVGIRLPSFSIGEHFLPDPGTLKLDLGAVLPNIAGINLDRLLGGLKIPNLDGVRVTHGVDSTTKRAWVDCTVHFDLQPATVFQAGPLEVRLSGGQLDAKTHVQAGPQGAPKRRVDAKIAGSWQLWVSGANLVSLDSTLLSFDSSGRFRFELDARNVHLHQALDFLSQLLKAYSPSPGSGLSIELTPGALGLPAGIKALLRLALPAIQTGGLSISNLALEASFALSVIQEFALETAFGLSSKDRPFNISVLALGGGGWFVTRAKYLPLSGQLQAGVSIGIAAGASIPFDIGIASGGVSLLASVSIDWATGASLEILLRLVLRGEVVVLGIISVSLLLALEAAYSEGALTCTGLLELHIKIGWIFSISLHEEVHFTVGAPKPAARPSALEQRNALLASPATDSVAPTAAPDFGPAVDDYINAFGGAAA